MVVPDQTVMSEISETISCLKDFGNALPSEKFPERIRSSRASALRLVEILEFIYKRIWEQLLTSSPPQFARIECDEVKTRLDDFESLLLKELRDLPLFSVGDKGNLSTEKLIDGSSSGYSSSTLSLLDDFVKREIDESGRCLAFNRPTACGFHIFRAVEICLKAYVLAAMGALPKMSQRNWGEYIAQLTGAGATSDLIDLLRILKTKRNPLMHPQDSLDVDEAIGIFCICENAIGVIISDVKAKGLDTKFTSALAALPTT
jgi:hypothetical protein